MTSAVDICNMALSHIRAGSITSLSQNTQQAIQCNLFYATCRDTCLEDASWGFATRIKQLALLDSDVFSAFNWAYVYAYPTDCLRVNRLILNYPTASSGEVTGAIRSYDPLLPSPGVETPVPYEILDIDGTLAIACNDADVWANYTWKVIDPNRFSASFKLALSHLLASHIAMPIVGVEKGSVLAKNSLGAYQSFINNAISKDLNQRYKEVADSEFITVRS